MSFEFKDNHTYSMPAHFGGRAGGLAALNYYDTVSATVWYQTDGEALAEFLPSGLSLESPVLMVSAVMNRGTEWMGYEPYNILAVNVPVTFNGKIDTISGWYSLVVWEDNTLPIVAGREGTGIPKIHGEIENFRFFENGMRTWAHRAGHTFCHLHFRDIVDAGEAERAEIDKNFSYMDWLAWRYIPRTSPKGGAELSQATVFPQEFESSRVRVGRADIEWSVPPSWQNPTQTHIIEALAALPVGDAVGPAVIMNAKNVLRSDLARVLS